MKQDVPINVETKLAGAEINSSRVSWKAVNEFALPDSCPGQWICMQFLLISVLAINLPLTLLKSLDALQSCTVQLQA